MVKRAYIPDRGDIVWLDFNPTKGHEQSGRRPALVLSRKQYNEKTNLALFCPITSKAKGYPFEVPVRIDDIRGVVLSDHVKNVDWKVRKAKFIAKVNEDVIEEVAGKLAVLVG
ncbi:endoribonuclease MazF [bacterium]|nr:endoribonuclease MazF [bacterium]